MLVGTVGRAVDFLHELAGDRLPSETYERIRRGILEMRAMPSMRLLAMAGPAARRNNVTIYNCSYQPVESIDSFVEALLISMSGCGVGFSVESKYVENFPRIKRQVGAAADLYVVEDSAEGWGHALRFGLERWFEGHDVHFDLDQIRPAGTPLQTKGGRASGPEARPPLVRSGAPGGRTSWKSKRTSPPSNQVSSACRSASAQPSAESSTTIRSGGVPRCRLIRGKLST